MKTAKMRSKTEVKTSSEKLPFLQLLSRASTLKSKEI